MMPEKSLYIQCYLSNIWLPKNYFLNLNNAWVMHNECHRRKYKNNLFNTFRYADYFISTLFSHIISI